MQRLFLIGGPSYSGTTLLTLLLNQKGLLCLDEPDVHNPAQSERGIPFLAELFPDADLPPRPTTALTFEEAVSLLEACERAIRPCELGMKTCDWTFVGYANVYRSLGYPVIGIVRDIRDALTRRLPEWSSEPHLNRAYRFVWTHRHLGHLWVRYEDLVSNPAGAVEQISNVLGRDVEAALAWDPTRVHRTMLKSDRHLLLRRGTISKDRVGIWRTSGKQFTAETHETARLMGY